MLLGYPMGEYGLYRRRMEVRRGLKVVVQPTAEPIDIVTARTHLNLYATGSPPTHPHDDLITGVYLPAAREACENYLGRALAPQTLELSLSRFPGGFVAGMLLPFEQWRLPREIELPMGPLLGVESVTYTDGDGNEQTFADYNVDTYSEPGRIRLKTGVSWPTTQDVPNAVIVRYQAGYSIPGSSPEDVQLPHAIRAAILLTLGDRYENRAATVAPGMIELPLGVQYLLTPYQVRSSMA